MSKRDAEATRMRQLVGQYSAVGIEMVVSVGVGAFGGQWLDERYGLHPWMTIAGLVIGIGAAGVTIQRLIAQSKRVLRPSEQDASDSGEPKSHDT